MGGIVLAPRPGNDRPASVISSPAMASALALVAAFLFALAATLQQKGALNLPHVSLGDPKSLVRLAGQTMWLVGTVVLLCGYVVQAAALDRGRLDVVQPLLVTTIVFALPLGVLLTAQHVGRREWLGACVIIVGLALFTLFGDPAGGRDTAPNWEWALAIVVIARTVGRTAPRRRPPRGAGGEGGRLRRRRRDPLRPVGRADEADGRPPPRGRRRRPLALGAVRARGRRHARVRPPAGLARHRPARAVGRDGLGREPGREHPPRRDPVRGAAEPAGLARRRRRRRPRARARGRGRDLARRRARRAPGTRATRPSPCRSSRDRDRNGADGRDPPAAAAADGEGRWRGSSASGCSGSCSSSPAST